MFIYLRSSFIPGFPLYSAPARFTLPPSRFFELPLLPLLRENEERERERLIGRRIIRFRAVSRCPKWRRRGGRFPPLCPSLASQSDRAFTRHAVDCRYSSSGRETQNHRPFSPLRNVDELPYNTFAFEARSVPRADERGAANWPLSLRRAIPRRHLSPRNGRRSCARPRAKSRKKGREEIRIGIGAIYLGIGIVCVEATIGERGGTLINEVVNNGNVSTENSAG